MYKLMIVLGETEEGSEQDSQKGQFGLMRNMSAAQPLYIVRRGHYLVI